MPASKTEKKLHDEMLSMYKYVGENTGYWGKRFLGAVKRKGGLAYAKQMLSKHLVNPVEQKGFQALVDCGAVHLSLEELILKPRYRSLFTAEELAEARRRLDSVPDYAKTKQRPAEEVHADDLQDETEYPEGAKKKIAVNAYERNPTARKACLDAHGKSCKVCGMNFRKVYGKLGQDFIHVHHIKPLAARKGKVYNLNPRKDLVPVCPNCHAMLHRKDLPMTIGDLKQQMGIT